MYNNVGQSCVGLHNRQMKPLSLYQRCDLYNAAYSHLPHQQLHVSRDKDGKDFASGFWFVGGGNVSNFYGSYQIEYLDRMYAMFTDAFNTKNGVVHLFSGSLPCSKDYTRVGIDPTGKYKSDLEIDAEQLSSFLPFKPHVIFADPPYSKDDAEHYEIGLVNRARVVDECAAVLQPGGFLIWMDQALPTFGNDKLRMVGCISYIRSTANRFRCVVLFQKPTR